MLKPTKYKNPQANAILECVHQVLAQMLCTTELDMAESVTLNDANAFLDNASWSICFTSTHHTVLKPSPGVAIFGCNMLFDITFVADWTKLEIIGNTKPMLTQHAYIAPKLIKIRKMATRFC
jgi:hypothetical protein